MIRGASKTTLGGGSRLDGQRVNSGEYNKTENVFLSAQINIEQIQQKYIHQEAIEEEETKSPEYEPYLKKLKTGSGIRLTEGI